MNSPVVVCAFDEPPPAMLAGLLRLSGQLRLLRGEQRPDLWISWAGFHEVEAALAAGLAQGQIRSAALLAGIPAPDRRWILTEWRGRLAVHRSLADLLDPRFWVDPSSYELAGLQTFAPSREVPGTPVTGYPSTPGRRRAEWVESAAEYRASLEAGRPTLVTASVQQLLTRMRDWFGELADERVGGAVTIMAMSGITPMARSPVVLRSAAALGLQRVTGTNTLAAHCSAGRVAARTWGTGADDPTRGIDWPGSTAPDATSLTAKLTRGKRMTGARYGVLIELITKVAAEMLIETGVIFEQLELNGVQNLAIAAPAIVAPNAGQSTMTALPAWCVNRHLAPPAGQPVRPTSLSLPLTVGLDQGTVWSIAERSPSGFGALA